jgi:hypothetical protein
MSRKESVFAHDVNLRSGMRCSSLHAAKQWCGWCIYGFSAPCNPPKPATDFALELIGEPAAIALDKLFDLALRGTPPRIL